MCTSLLLPCSLSCSCSSSSSAGGSGAFTKCRDTWQPGGSRFSVQNCLNFDMKTCGGVLVYSTVICSIRYYMCMKLVYVVYTGSSVSCLQFVYRVSCCHNLSAAHKKKFHGVCHLFRPRLYTRSRKACRPIARAPLSPPFCDWIGPGHHPFIPARAIHFRIVALVYYAIVAY